MQYSSWIPLIAGIALIAGLMAYIFKSQTIPAIVAPLVLIAAILCALPYLQNFAFKGAGLEWSASLIKQDLAGQSATIQGDITEIRKSLNALLEKSGVAPPIVAPGRRQSVLVFYGEGKEPLANQIRAWLLNEGFDSSATATDFSELGKSIQSPGTVKLRFVSSAAPSIPGLIQKLSAAFPQLGTIQTQQEDKLARGDAQLLLF